MMNKEEYQQYKEENYTQFEVNGVELRFVRRAIQPDCRLWLGGTKWSLHPQTTYAQVYKAAGLKTYDFALPQSFWDEYYHKHEHPPQGVWCYDNSFFGEFYSYSMAMHTIVDHIIERAFTIKCE